MMLWSKKLWEKIKAMQITEEVFDAVDSFRLRNDVIYMTNWNKQYQESVRTYLKRQLKVQAVHDLVAEKKALGDLEGSSDDIIRYWLLWIHKNITYVSDKKKFGTPEYWEDVDNVLKTKQADCESGATLLYSLCRASSVPRSRLRLWAGNVQQQGVTGLTGHCWLEARSVEDGEWRVVDWCFNFNPYVLCYRPRTEPAYVERWWGFDELRCYLGD